MKCIILLKMIVNLKNIAIILLTAAILSACDTSIGPQENYDAALHTETKWLVEYSTNNKISQIHFKEYDRKGNLIFLKEFSEQGQIQFQSAYNYDFGSRLEEKFLYDEFGNIIDSNICTYHYNEFGDIDRIVSLAGDGDTLSITNIFYDEYRNVTRRIKQGSEGIEEINIDYTYNNSGNVVERVVKNPAAGGTIIRDSIAYSFDKNLIEYYQFGSGGEIQERRAIRYNNYGKIANEKIFNTDGEISRFYIYEYTFY